MAKPDPALLDPARYPFSWRFEPRFGDLDTNMHINNVAMATMLEDSRVRLQRASGYYKPGGDRMAMVASIAIEYLEQATYPEAITIHGAVERLGRTSLTLVQIALQADRPVVFARTVMVSVDAGGPATLTSAFLATAGDWSLRP